MSSELSHIAIVLLAAGDGTRYSKDGRGKLYHEVDGRTMLDIACGLASAAADTYIVTKTKTAEWVNEHYPSVRTIINEDGHKGASLSIRMGTQAAKNDADAIMFMVCDQPYLTHGTLCGLMDVYRREGKGIACVCCAGRTGNPVIFSARYAQELEGLSGDTGGKAVMKRHMDDVAFYEIDDERELADIDTNEED